MRWGLALGAAGTLGAAAVIGTQWAGHLVVAPDAQYAAREAVALPESTAVGGGFMAGIFAGATAGIISLEPMGERTSETAGEIPADA